MVRLTQLASRISASRLCRACLACVVLVTCALAIARAVVVEAFEIPTGSMAPCLLGRHRVCICPQCGHEVVVGRHRLDPEGGTKAGLYRKAFCHHCDHFPLPVADAVEKPGDQVIVNKAAFLVRQPARWEIIVFRLFGSFFVKRLLGLPGDEIAIKDGDVYVNGNLCRKSLEHARSMRVLLKQGVSLLADDGKCDPIRDEYAYNAGVHADSELVHDFHLELDVEARPGVGTLTLRLCDGQDWVAMLIPMGTGGRIDMTTWPMSQPGEVRSLGTANGPSLVAGRRHRVELAFVDRRVSLAVDGQVLLEHDLPETATRQGVARPFEVVTSGAAVTIHDVRLYRDVHYGQQGKNGVRGKSVRLGVDQYFFLGDNSPHSHDSRFWPDDGIVPRACLIGPAMRVRRTDQRRE